MCDTNAFKSEIAKLTPRPKGVKVHPQLFDALVKENLVEFLPCILKHATSGTSWEAGFSLPFYQKNIYVERDPSFEITGTFLQLPETNA